MLEFYAVPTPKNTYEIRLKGYTTPDPIVWVFADRINVDMALQNPEKCFAIWPYARELDLYEMAKLMERYKNQSTISTGTVSTIPAPAQKLPPGITAQCKCGYQNSYYEFENYTCTQCKIWERIVG